MSVNQTEEKKAWILSQEEAGYVSLSASRGKACANCRFFTPPGTDWQADGANIDNRCHIVSSWPLPILPTGVCDWHTELVMEQTEPEPMPVVIVEPEIEMDEMERALQKPNVLQRLLKAIKDVISQPEQVGGFKALDDGTHWVAWFSNNFEDREAEILSEKAHDSYIRRLDAGLVPMPELWYWHIPGTAHGKALWVGRIDHMVVAVGEFDDSPLAKAFQAHYAKSKEAVSHGFKADKSKHFQNGVWSDYNTFEISPLPLDAAANPFTLFTEADMLSEEKLAALETIIGKEAAAQIVEKSKQWSKEIEPLARYKEFADPATLGNPADAAAVENLSKNVGPMLLEIAATQGDFVGIIKGIEASFKQQLDTVLAQVEAVKQENESLKAQLSLTPRRATQETSTQLSAEEAKALESQLPGPEFDSFFGDLNIPVKRG